MASTITIFREADNSYYQVNVDLYNGVLSVNPDGSITGQNDSYFMFNTSIRKTDGSNFQQFIARSLSDVPNGFPPASNFSELVGTYVDYFLTVAEFGQSSSSSYSSSSSSTELMSTSSSTIGLTSSSSSSSFSSSSSSTIGLTSSSSSS